MIANCKLQIENFVCNLERQRVKQPKGIANLKFAFCNLQFLCNTERRNENHNSLRHNWADRWQCQRGAGDRRRRAAGAGPGLALSV